MDPASNACPTCGTVRGKYDRFCTGCGRDLGAPGAALGPMIKGPAMGRPGSAGPSTLSVHGPGPAAPRYATTRPLGAPVAPDSRSFAQINPSTYLAERTGRRFWRTIAMANRILAVAWLAFFALGTMVALSNGTSLSTSSGNYVLGFLIAAVLPAVLAWYAADRLEAGSPILRLVAYVEIAFLVIVTFGLFLIPLLVIYIFAGGRAEVASV